MKNIKLYIGLLLISAGALVVAICAYAYMYNDTISHTEHAIAARSAVSDEVRREQQSKDILTLASSTAASREAVKHFFVPTDDAVTFIQAVESIGSASGASLSIQSIAAVPSGPTKPGTIGTITAHITMSGSWTTIMKALELFENLPYRSSIDRLSLSTSVAPDRAGQAVHSWSAGFDITAPTLN